MLWFQKRGRKSYTETLEEKKGKGKCNYKTIVLKIKKRIEEHI